MNEHLEQLDLVLGHQIAGLTALKNWLPRKIALIRDNQLAELRAFNLREEDQVNRLQQAESQRQVLVGLLAHELGLPANAPLSAFVTHVPAPYAERLAARLAQLAALSAQYKRGHKQVAELLRVSLAFVHFKMDVFAQLATARPPSAYSGFGDPIAPGVGSWLVDRQA